MKFRHIAMPPEEALLELLGDTRLHPRLADHATILCALLGQPGEPPPAAAVRAAASAAP